MVSSQPRRTGSQAGWAPGSLNRGFVSLDPERQPEEITEPLDAGAARFAFGVRAPAARAGRPRTAAPDHGAQPRAKKPRQRK